MNFNGFGSPFGNLTYSDNINSSMFSVEHDWIIVKVIQFIYFIFHHFLHEYFPYSTSSFQRVSSFYVTKILTNIVFPFYVSTKLIAVTSSYLAFDCITTVRNDPIIWFKLNSSTKLLFAASIDSIKPNFQSSMIKHVILSIAKLIKI